MHMSGDDMNSENNIDILMSDDNTRDRSQSGEGIEHNNPNNTRNNDTTLQENVNNQEGVNPYVDMPPLETDKSEEDTGGVPPDRKQQQ